MQKILLISGSLRKHSTNTGLLRACAKVGHPKMQFQWASLDDIPMFNQELEADLPASVVRVKAQVKQAQGLLCGVPQYNKAMSGSLKNIYDWLSRGGFIKHCPVALVSSGSNGALSARANFRSVGEYCKVQFMPNDSICVQRYAQTFDQEGNLTHSPTLEKIPAFLNQFYAWNVECQQKYPR